jgi:hypothetical protein
VLVVHVGVTSRADGEGGVAVFRSARGVESPNGMVAVGLRGAEADVYSQEERNPRSRTELPKVNFDW